MILMKFYFSRVLGNEALLINGFYLNGAEVLLLFYFVKSVISGRDVTALHHSPKVDVSTI